MTSRKEGTKGREETGEKQKVKVKEVLDIRRVAAFVAIVLIVCIVSYYFLAFAPTEIKSNETAEATAQRASQITEIVEKLDGAMLMAKDGKPEIELNVTDLGIFTISVDNGIVATTPGHAANPDIRIVMESVYLTKLLTAARSGRDALNEEVVKLYKEGKIDVELLKDMDTLIAKGYKEIYDGLEPLLR